MKKYINAALSCIFLIYPFAVYFLLDHTSIRVFGLLLLLILAGRFYYLKEKLNYRENFWLVLVAILFFSLLFLLNNITILKLYPVLINLGLLLVFVLSVIYPPTVIERIARLQKSDLSQRAVDYTRKVTLIWIGFFFINLIISAGLALFASLKAWTLYVGLISYLLIFTLMGLELLCRHLYIKPDET